jgi:hypothetical protein
VPLQSAKPREGHRRLPLHLEIFGAEVSSCVTQGGHPNSALRCLLSAVKATLVGWKLAGSLGLDICELDHFGPFVGFVGNEFAKIYTQDKTD